MSMKDGVAFVKKELSGDEQVLESALKLETFYKKYKVMIWGALVAMTLFFVGKSIMDMMETKRLAEANQALLVLQSNPKEKEALQMLQEKNPALFELFSYKEAINSSDTKRLQALSKSVNEIISDMSRYGLHTLENKASSSKLYEEMALINKAYLALESGEIKKVQDTLTLIPEESALAPVGSLLRHATVKGK